MYELQELATAFSNQFGLKISAAEQRKAWEQAQNHSNAIARYNAYLNRICLHTFLNWLSDWLAEESAPKPSIWPSEDTLPSIWEVVNGTAIQLGESRIVLIPSETTDLEELCVPQEWVDIPSFAADYYLAVLINLEGDEDDCWMGVCGFATHRQLKYKGRYNSSDRTYVLSAENLTENLTVMQVTLGLRMQEEIPELPTLSEAEAKKLLQLLSDSSIYSPRLRVDVPFEQWAALLVDDKWRQQLYNRRMVNPDSTVTAVAAATSSRSQVTAVAAATSSRFVVDLRQWLENLVEERRNLVEEVWQTFETFFAPLEPNPVRGTRGSALTSPDAIAPVISLLQPNQPEQIRCQAAGVLGEIGAGNPEAIKALTELLHTAQDEETRWQAALSLGKIDPRNPQAGIKKARLIDLGMQLGDHAVALVVAIMPRADGRTGVFLQVQPYRETKLPPHLKLSVLSESSETIPGLEVAARSNDEGQGYTGDKDKSIALRFNPPLGKRFRVKVTLNDVNVIEDFVA
ncbi:MULTISPECIES: DUF1822 family protein [Cyanophyceae]|uniref:DUF1822 family protein n=1 Tax=Cyanophyceae TaxID=3028117 RepID=UPI00168644B1|nr:DUF1822 family protein [Trichocoleus sp. FACHB-40]MBD2002739.1 DUF1822 family protein [Trichocoleus sp. FACHB-40]